MAASQWRVQPIEAAPGATRDVDLGCYATDREAITAASEQALAAAAAHHGLTVEALMAMPFEQRYERVRQARTKSAV